MTKEEAREYKKSWRLKNKEKCTQYSKTYRLKNRVRLNKEAALYHKLHPEAARKAVNKWRANHPVEAKAAVDKWRKNNLDKCRTQARNAARKYCETLSNTYIVQRLKRSYLVSDKQISTELIEAKKQCLTLKRTLNEKRLKVC